MGKLIKKCSSFENCKNCRVCRKEFSLSSLKDNMCKKCFPFKPKVSACFKCQAVFRNRGKLFRHLKCNIDHQV